MPAGWRRIAEVRHGLTHFELRLDLYAARVPSIVADGFLCRSDALDAEALPSVMRKCARQALERLPTPEQPARVCGGGSVPLA